MAALLLDVLLADSGPPLDYLHYLASHKPKPTELLLSLPKPDSLLTTCGEGGKSSLNGTLPKEASAPTRHWACDPY